MRTALASIIASSTWAIDGSYPVAATLQTLGEHTESDVSAEQLRTSGRFHHYVNPNGEVVSSMEQDFSRRIQQGAIAVIPAKGIMVKECATWMEYYGLCGTERVARDIDRAMADDRVKEIVCIVSSPGGDIAGIENLDRTVQAAAKKKTITGFLDNLACSAAYWGFTHCTRLVADGQTTIVGSLGVMTTIEDDSQFWKALGIEVKDIYDATSGDKNKDYNDALAGNIKGLQERLAPLKAAMVAAVTDGRKGLIDRGREDVLTGKLYLGTAAKDHGLIDRIDSLKAVLHEAITPNTTPPTPAPTQATTTTMKFSAIWAAALTALGFSDSKTTATAEDITKANAELKDSGLQLVTAEQAKELAGLATLKAEAAKVAGLEAQVATATANDTAVKAALKDIGLTADAGKELETLIAKVKAAPGATHTGAKKEGDPEKKVWAGHDEALASMDVVADASVKGTN